MNYAENTAAGQPRNPNFVDTVSFAEERTDSLVKRLDALVDRLCGSQPTPPEAGKASLQVAVNGHFDSVMATASRIGTRADYGMRLLDRLESSLP